MMRALVTGCCGFIGYHLCRALVRDGSWEVIGIDSLVRNYPLVVLPDSFEFIKEDVCNIHKIPLPNVDFVFHLAAQVSVTRSVTSPMYDFRANAEGTFRVAQWAREHDCMKFIYASTNKVYGGLPLRKTPIHTHEDKNPRTPYGVSKYVGALYVREFFPEDAHSIFHQSCIMGPEQIGSIDQGWVAWVRHCINSGLPITCFGTGEQVRDLLHVDDLIDLYLRDDVCGEHVVGGGDLNAFKFKNVVSALGGEIARYEDWRPYDQEYFVSANDTLPQDWEPSLIHVGDLEGKEREGNQQTVPEPSSG